MAFNELVAKARTHFPDLQIKYKNEDTFMKILGTLMFFNPGFMTSFITTIGDTIYWPNREFVQNNPQAVSEVFIHECTHIYDEKRVGSLPFKAGYLFPQILALPMLLLLFVLTWKIVLPLVILCLLPLPAPFRAYFERRAYFVSMRVGYGLYGWNPRTIGIGAAKNFKNSSYYWMMPFGEDEKFLAEATNVLTGKPESASELALDKMINDLMTVAK